MELASLSVDTQKALWLPLRETKIIPLGDIQFALKDGKPSQTVDLHRLERLVAWGVKQGAYWLGMGDYIDYASPSNRRILRKEVESEGLYDSVSDLLDDGAERTLDALWKVLEPTKGRWLGLLQGHHYWVDQQGVTTDQRLAGLLNCPFLGTSAIIEVGFKMTRKRSPASFQIWAHHGVGSGKDPLGKLRRDVIPYWPTVDVFLIGHFHRKAATKDPAIRAVFGLDGRGTLIDRPRILAATGSFLKGYMEGHEVHGRPSGPYPEQKMLAPLALGNVVIWARPRASGGYTRVDLDVSL